MKKRTIIFGRKRKNMEEFLSLKSVFSYFQTAITYISRVVRGCSLHGWKALGKIFPKAQFLLIFNVVWGRYNFRKLGYWTLKSPIHTFSKSKVVFSPYNFLNSFKGLLEVKVRVKPVLSGFQYSKVHLNIMKSSINMNYEPWIYNPI